MKVEITDSEDWFVIEEPRESRGDYVPSLFYIVVAKDENAALKKLAGELWGELDEDGKRRFPTVEKYLECSIADNRFYVNSASFMGDYS